MRRFLIPIILLVGLFVLVALSQGWFSREEKTLAASGTLEARNISIGSKVGGRITQVLAAEGDRVKSGQLLIVFDDAELHARVLQARGRVEQARANLAKFERGFRTEEVAEARAATGSRAAEVEQARFELARAEAELENATTNHRRVMSLVQQGIFAKQQGDDAQARLDAAQAAVAALRKSVAAAEARMNAAQAGETLAERGFRAEEIAAARADLHRAEGELKEAEARYAEREVRAPADAVVEVLDIRPGDLVGPNAPLARLLEADQLYVMVYVPQTQIGRVRVGQRAQVTTDAFRDQPFTATVEQIRQQAEFLPRNVQTREERVHQVIGVKLRVEDPGGRLRAGTNADVRFLDEAAR